MTEEQKLLAVGVTKDPELVIEIDRIEREEIGRPILARRNGLVADALKCLGRIDTPSRRSFVKNALIVIGTASAVGSLIEGYPAVQQFLTKDDHDKHNYGIGAGFAAHVASRPYNDDNIRRDWGSSINKGEEALLRSIADYRAGDVVGLNVNMHELEKAVARSDEKPSDGRALALARLMADASFLGDGELCQKYLEESAAALSNVGDHNVRLRVLDVATTLALNLISVGNLSTLHSGPLEAILGTWDDIAGGDARRMSPEQLYAKYGIESTGVLQQEWLRKTLQMHRGNVANPQASARNLRRDYLDRLVEKTLANISTVSEQREAKRIAEDFLYSLHRLTFHAASSRDRQQTNEFLDIYFGRGNLGKNHPLIDEARSMVAASLPGSTPWMFLLDASLAEGVAEKSIRFAKLEGKKLSNPQLDRARKEVKRSLSYKLFSTDLWPERPVLVQEVHELALHEAYTLTVCNFAQGEE